jgi:hypothetical protein
MAEGVHRKPWAAFLNPGIQVGEVSTGVGFI